MFIGEIGNSTVIIKISSPATLMAIRNNNTRSICWKIHVYICHQDGPCVRGNEIDMEIDIEMTSLYSFGQIRITDADDTVLDGEK